MSKINKILLGIEVGRLQCGLQHFQRKVRVLLTPSTLYSKDSIDVAFINTRCFNSGIANAEICSACGYLQFRK